MNRRLENGEPGKQVVAWLNGLPEVQQVLQEQSGGRTIREQNLSEWKQGGYRDWLRYAEVCAWVRRLTEQAGDLEASAEDVAVGDRCAPMLAVELIGFPLTSQLEVGSTSNLGSDCEPVVLGLLRTAFS